MLNLWLGTAGGIGRGSLSQTFPDDLVLLFCVQLRITVSNVFNSGSLEPSTGLQYIFIE